MEPNDRTTREAQYIFPTWEVLDQFCKRALPLELHDQFETRTAMSADGIEYRMSAIIRAATTLVEAAPERIHHAAFIIRAIGFTTNVSLIDIGRAVNVMDSLSQIPVEYLDIVFPGRLGEHAISHGHYLFYAISEFYAANVPAEYVHDLDIGRDTAFWSPDGSGVLLHQAGVPAAYGAHLRAWPTDLILHLHKLGVPAEYAGEYRNPDPGYADIRVEGIRVEDIARYYSLKIPAAYARIAEQAGVDSATVIAYWEKGIPVEYLDVLGGADNGH